MRLFRFVATSVLFALSILLTGCTISTTALPTAEEGQDFGGVVHGGQNAISSAHIYMFAANTQGFAGPGMAASTTNASVPIVLTGSNVQTDSTGTYILTDANGGFSFGSNASYSCTQGQDVYLYVTGGNPGAGTNTAISLMAVLGTCPAGGSFASIAPRVTISETTTIAAAYALAGFATDPLHIADDEGLIANTTASTAQMGMANAFTTATLLAARDSGHASTTIGGATYPQLEVNQLANILAACVNTTGAVTGPTTPTACYTLFYNALSGGATGNVPSDTATAAINIAHYPGVSSAVESALAGLSNSNAPFQPTSTNSTPNDFTLGVSITGGGLGSNTYVNGVAIDASGNVWTDTGQSDVSEFSPFGAAMSPSGGFTGGGNLNQAYQIAIDPVNANVWVANAYENVVILKGSDGSLVSNLTGNTLNNPAAAVFDFSNNVWIGDTYGYPQGYQAIAKFTNTGTALSSSDGVATGYAPTYLIADSSGNLWSHDGANLRVYSTSTQAQTAEYTVGSSGVYDATGIEFDSTGAMWQGTYYSGYYKWTSNYSVISEPYALSAGCNYGLAVDPNGNVWVPCSTGNKFSGLSSSGSVKGPSGGYQPVGMYGGAVSIAIDASGNLWMPTNNNTLEEVIGVSAPVVVPTALAVQQSKIAMRP